MPTYFGRTDASGSGEYTGMGALTPGYVKVNAAYQCGGSGDQLVTSLSVWCKRNVGFEVYVRMAVYSLDLSTLLFYATTAKQPTDTATWLTWSDAEITRVSSSVLTPSTQYAPVFTFGVGVNAAYFYGYAFSGSSGDTKYNTTDYTSTAWPSSITLGSNDSVEWVLRVGTDPAGSGGSINASDVGDSYEWD